MARQGARWTRAGPGARGVRRGAGEDAGDGVASSALEAVAGRVAADTRIEALAAEVVNADKPFLVIGANGQTLGLLTREAVLAVLVGGKRGRCGMRASRACAWRRRRGTPARPWTDRAISDQLEPRGFKLIG